MKPVSTACAAQTPAKQSACSSSRTDRALALAVAADALVDAQQVLDVVPVLVREDVGLGERATLGAEARAQLVEEAEVDVDRLVGRAVERADRGASPRRSRSASAR